MSAIPSWARVGAKVVLVDDSPARHGNGASHKGDICVILELRLIGSVPACRVREQNNRYCASLNEWTRLSRFRPLVTIEDDISTHFERLLDVPANHEREAA